MLKPFINILLFLFTTAILAQDSIPYSHDFDFNEGIYLTKEQFLKNAPIVRSSIVSSILTTEQDLFTQLLEQKTFSYKDASGNIIIVESSSVWGYCQNRTLYLHFNKEFHRLNVIGTLCHFTAVVIVRGVGYQDPMSYNYGINSNYQELKQFVYDTRSNKVHDFNASNMAILIADDLELSSEFNGLSKRKKTESIFIYLRKYNEKHPLYLLKN